MTIQVPIPKQKLLQTKVPGLFLICFSGGPCAGKSKSIHHLIDKFEATETKILVAPEVATMISKSGGFIDMGEWSEKKIVEFQANLLLCQIDFEYQLFRIAERLLARQAYKQVIIICDRGLMDGKAYFKDELWFNMLKNFQVGENQICDQRYDSVFLFETAALGVESFYQGDKVRYESREIAIETHNRTAKVWERHLNLRNIGNEGTTSFEDKLLKVERQLEGVIAQPRGL